MSTEQTTEQLEAQANKLDRETVFAEQDIEKVSAILESDVTLFKEEISSLDLEGLKKVEADLMEDFKEDEVRLQSVAYTLPASVAYDGHTVKRSDVVNKVIGFLNRIEVPFQASLGLYQCIRFWKTQGSSPDTNIPYGAFDSTLRMLGNLKFKGEQDCFDILVINDWFTAGHDGYRRDNMWMAYLSMKHQAIMTAMEALQKAPAEAGPDAQI